MDKRKTAAQKALTDKLTFEVDEQELTVIIIEACCGIKRPDNQTPKQIIDEIDAGKTPLSKESIDGLKTAAKKSMIYFAQCIQTSQRLN